MSEHDIALEWIETNVPSMFETDYDGMENDGDSEPFEYNNGYKGEQPYA